MQRVSWQERQHNVPRHPHSDITNADQPSSMDLDEKRELIKARRRAAYRKKKEEATVKQQEENLSALTISDMLNVGGLPLGDITNVCQPTTVDLDDKKEQLKSRRRAAYRKKKEEAASKQKVEKQLEEEHKGDLTDEQTEQRNAWRMLHADMLNVGGLPLGDITNVCQPTTVDLDDKKEQLKSRRRAAYRKKKEEAASKQKVEKQLEEEHKGDLTDEQTEQRNARRMLHGDMLNVGGLPLGDITNVCQPTTVDLDDKKEQLKSRRRAAYRKKKEEAASKQKDENLSALSISDMQNIPLLPLGDTTNGCEPFSVDLDEKKEQMKARRRAAYRKKKEEAASKQLDEKQLEEEHKGDLTDEQTEQRNARRRASYRRKVGDGTIDLEEKNQMLQEWRACNTLKP
nr:uncharacterized protein LOC123494120 [Aegilops tauschii subsp. strangulata]